MSSQNCTCSIEKQVVIANQKVGLKKYILDIYIYSRYLYILDIYIYLFNIYISSERNIFLQKAKSTMTSLSL